MSEIKLSSSSHTNSLPRRAYKNISYPELRSSYTQKTGYLGENIIIENLEEYPDIKTELHLLNAKGTDIVVKKYDIGIEVWNHQKAHSYNKRIESVLTNLKSFKHKFLISSFISPETKKIIEEYYPHNPVKIIVTGFQFLPDEYLKYYQQNRATRGKMFSIKRASKILRNILRPIFDIVKSIPSISSYVYSTCRTNSNYKLSSRSNVTGASKGLKVIFQQSKLTPDVSFNQNKPSISRNTGPTSITEYITNIKVTLDSIINGLKATLQYITSLGLNSNINRPNICKNTGPKTNNMKLIVNSLKHLTRRIKNKLYMAMLQIENH